MASRDTDDELSVVSAKIPRDLRQKVDEIQQPDESRSNTLRRLIRRGVEGDETPNNFRRQLQGVATSFGLLYLVSYVTLAPMVQSIIGASAIATISIMSIWVEVKPLLVALAPDIKSNTTKTEQ